jgi:hypothetical protein
MRLSFKPNYKISILTLLCVILITVSLMTGCTLNGANATTTSTIPVKTDEDSVNEDMAELTAAQIKGTNQDLDHVTTDLASPLPATGTNGSTITWSSDNTGVITDSGTVTRPANGSGNTVVTFTATVSKGSVTDTVVFTITVLEMPKTYTNGMDASLVFGQPDFTTGDAPVSATQGSINLPTGLWIADNKLFVADANANRVKIWNSIPASDNVLPDVVIGQADFTGSSQATTDSGLRLPRGVFSDGTKLFVADAANNRVLIWNTIPTTNGQAADVVVGQTDFTTQTSGTSATKLKGPYSVFTAGGKMLVTEYDNCRVLIYNTIPTTNGAAADLVLGQPNLTTGTLPTVATASNLRLPSCVWTDGTKVLVYDQGFNRILIWNSFPTSNGQAADLVIGQADLTSNGSGTAADKLKSAFGTNSLFVSGEGKLFATDHGNHRILVFDSIPSANSASASYVIGQADFTSGSSATTRSGLNLPTGLALDSSGGIWVSDYNNNRFLKF